MPAAYDTYNYEGYWEGREYEHQSEVIALKAFLHKIPEISKIVEIGAGFGRLTPFYSFRAKRIILTDPSARLLSVAKESLEEKNIKFVQSKIENLPGKIKSGTTDLAIMIRVLHHLTDLDEVFSIVNKLLKNRGHFILEFANKRHFKASMKELIKGNITYTLDIFPKDIRSKKSIKKGVLPFINYHPDIVSEKLKENGFEIKDCLSVSNIRSTFLKRRLPLNFLLSLEEYSQKPLSYFNFGPSMFILAQKKDN